MRALLCLVPALVALTACAAPQTVDAGQDASPADAGVAIDANVASDAGLDAARSDTGVGDADVALDAGAIDAGVDAGAPDAGPTLTTTVTWTSADGLPEAACAPWTLFDSATPEDPELRGGALLLSTSENAELMYYYHDEPDLIVPEVLTIEARLRLISGSSSTPSRAPAFLGYRIGPSLRKQLLHIRDGQIFLLSSENVAGPSVNVPTTDGPHDYRLEMDSDTGEVRVYYDGSLVLTGSSYPEPGAGATARIFFGEGSVHAYGASEWLSVRHNAHRAVACP